MRPVLPSGRTWKVAGSGIATMSDSSIALKPVTDEPSKPIPSSSAPSTSLAVIEKLFRWPSMSVNHSSTSSMPRSLISFRTSLRAPGSDVARFLLSTCAMTPPRSARRRGAYTGFLGTLERVDADNPAALEGSLARLAGWVGRRRRTVVAAWVVALAAGGWFSLHQSSHLSGGGWEVPGSPSMRVANELDSFPG